MATPITLTPKPAQPHSAWASQDGNYVCHSGGWYVRQQGMARPYTGEHRMHDQAGRMWSRAIFSAVVGDFGDLVEVAS